MTAMTATKMLSYNNRRLVPGEDFEAKSPRDLKVLLATRKAKLKREPGEVAPPPPAVAAKVAALVTAPEQVLAEARAQYEEKVGRRPYYGWTIEQLREKIAAASE